MKEYDPKDERNPSLYKSRYQREVRKACSLALASPRRHSRQRTPRGSVLSDKSDDLASRNETKKIIVLRLIIDVRWQEIVSATPNRLSLNKEHHVTIVYAMGCCTRKPFLGQILKTTRYGVRFAPNLGDVFASRVLKLPGGG